VFGNPNRPTPPPSQLAEEQGIEVPGTTVAELRKHVEVSMDCESLSEYLQSFAITLKVLQKPYAITRVMYELVEDCKKDGVRYVEVRFSPVLHTQEGLSLSAVMEAVCEGRLLAESRLGVPTRVIVCGMRHLDPSVSESLAEIAWRYKESGVVAFDLAGPETGNSSTVHKSAFDIVRKHHINCTIHAGEEPKAGWQSIWDSIRHCGAHRIGHGVQLRHNSKLRDFVVDQGIGVEVCITSNMQTKAIGAAAEHPLREFFDAGVRLVPCTDNRTVSGIDLTGEYALIHNELGFEPWEVLAMMDNGFSTAFIEYPERRRLRADCFHDALRLLVEAGIDVDPIIARFADAIELGDLAEVVADARRAAEGPGRRPYWRGIEVPEATEEMIRRLPKTDLHCRLDGSVTPEFVGAELARLPAEDAEGLILAAERAIARQGSQGAAQGNPEDRMVTGEHSAASYTARATAVFASRACRADAKRLIRRLLRDADATERAVADVLDQCAADGVAYVELMVRPWSHFAPVSAIAEGPSAAAVAEVVARVRRAVCAYCASAANTARDIPVTAAVVIYVTHPEDDPIVVRAAADIAVAASQELDAGANGMCALAGLGLYGNDLPEQAIPLYLSTFALLKAHHVRVAVSAGSDVGSACTCGRGGGVFFFSFFFFFFLFFLCSELTIKLFFVWWFIATV
jgi:adenosine deaminase